jgi:hypothetical protein
MYNDSIRKRQVDTRKAHTTMTNRQRTEAEYTVAASFATADAEQRVQAAARDVDARAVALEQWYVWFQAGKWSQARQWWVEQVEGTK